MVFIFSPARRAGVANGDDAEYRIIEQNNEIAVLLCGAMFSGVPHCRGGSILLVGGRANIGFKRARG